MPRSFSPEFDLLLACCRWPYPDDNGACIAALAAKVDWSGFVMLAARHRVQGLVWKALAAAPDAVPGFAKAALSAAAADIARQNLMLAAESVQLSRLLQVAGLSPLFVKGVTLGILAYGDIARKAGWDIDLLVAPDDLGTAATVLAARGYKLVIPQTENARLDLPLWHRHAKESVWRSANGAVWVELHTALTDNPLLLPGVGTASPRRIIEVSPGFLLPTLACDELFAYLCVHGASSAWFRLKWIADLAALLGGKSAEEIERIYRRSLVLGAGRAPAQALLLIDELYGLSIPLPLRRELYADRTTRVLTRIALRKLTGRAGTVELDQVSFGTLSIHLAQLGLMPGWRYKRTALARIMINPVDRIATPLPSALRWLYPVIQGWRLAVERRRG